MSDFATLPSAWVEGWKGCSIVGGASVWGVGSADNPTKLWPTLTSKLRLRSRSSLLPSEADTIAGSYASLLLSPTCSETHSETLVHSSCLCFVNLSSTGQAQCVKVVEGIEVGRRQ